MQLASSLDLMPTITKITGAGGPPKDVVLDGVDMSPILFNTGKVQHQSCQHSLVSPENEHAIGLICRARGILSFTTLRHLIQIMEYMLSGGSSTKLITLHKGTS